jgi:MFS family permease
MTERVETFLHNEFISCPLFSVPCASLLKITERVLNFCPTMYQAEVSTPESRGLMVSMHAVMFAVGYSLSAWIGFGCYFISASGSRYNFWFQSSTSYEQSLNQERSSFPWRFPFAFQGAPALLLLFGSPWLPKSPRWLLQQEYVFLRLVIRKHPAWLPSPSTLCN